MRPLWTTLVPMLAVAALVLWGGERLARRTVEERIPADRERLFDFTETMRAELDRLDSVYAAHLSGIAMNASYLNRDQLAKRCENLVGIRSCHRFVSIHKEFEVQGMKPPVGEAAMIPELFAEGSEGRVPPKNSVVLPKELLDGADEANGWLSGPEVKHRVLAADRASAGGGFRD
jgi:hypothetical protein